MFRSFAVVAIVLCHGRMGYALPEIGQVISSGQPEEMSVSGEVANAEGRSGAVSPAADYDNEDGDAPESLPSNPSADEVSGSSPEAGLDDAYLSRKKRLVNPSLDLVQDSFPEKVNAGSKPQVPYYPNFVSTTQPTMFGPLQYNPSIANPPPHSPTATPIPQQGMVEMSYALHRANPSAAMMPNGMSNGGGAGQFSQ